MVVFDTTARENVLQVCMHNFPLATVQKLHLAPTPAYYKIVYCTKLHMRDCA